MKQTQQIILYSHIYRYFPTKDLLYCVKEFINKKKKITNRRWPLGIVISKDRSMHKEMVRSQERLRRMHHHPPVTT